MKGRLLFNAVTGISKLTVHNVICEKYGKKLHSYIVIYSYWNTVVPLDEVT